MSFDLSSDNNPLNLPTFNFFSDPNVNMSDLLSTPNSDPRATYKLFFKCGHCQTTTTPPPHVSVKDLSPDQFHCSAIHIRSLCQQCERHNDFVLSAAQYAESQAWLERLGTVAIPQPGDSEEVLASRAAWGTYNEGERRAYDDAKIMQKGNINFLCGHQANGVEWGDGENIAKRKCEGCLERQKRNEQQMRGRGNQRRW